MSTTCRPSTGPVPVIAPESPFQRFGRTTFTELHPDTDPARIREIQTRDVYHAHQVLGTLDVQTISDYTDLPVWNIHRALQSLGLDVGPLTPKVKPQSLSEKLLEIFAARKWFTLHNLCKATGEPVARVKNWISGNSSRLERKTHGDKLGQQKRYWRLKMKTRTECSTNNHG